MTVIVGGIQDLPKTVRFHCAIMYGLVLKNQLDQNWFILGILFSTSLVRGWCKDKLFTRVLHVQFM